MKRCTFHVPVMHVQVVSVVGNDEADCRLKLDSGQDAELLYAFEGCTESGGIELILCTDLPTTGEQQGETSGQ